jgi:hypothetical protein
MCCLTVQDLQPSSFFRDETCRFLIPHLGTFGDVSENRAGPQVTLRKVLATFSFDQCEALALIKLHQALSTVTQSKECNYRQIKSDLLDLYQQWEETRFRISSFSPWPLRDEAILQHMLFEISGPGKLLSTDRRQHFEGMMVNRWDVVKRVHETLQQSSSTK